MTAKLRIAAIDRFIKGLKEDGIYDDLNACCVMAGWDSLAGALTPLKGTAPTNSGFLAADFDRGIGLKGNGSSKYLNSNRNNNADGQNDNHNAVWVSSPESSGSTGYYIDSNAQSVGDNNLGRSGFPTNLFVRNRSQFGTTVAKGDAVGLIGHSRIASAGFTFHAKGSGSQISSTSETPSSTSVLVFARPATAFTNATLSFYSIGSSLGSDPATGLAALDARVSTLMADLRAIEEVGFDSSAIEYIRNVEAADGAFLETDVKIAINNLVSGLKSEGLWDAIGASCLLCGPRTLAGALVPLKGDAPTPYGFVSGDYSRTNGLGDPDAASYLDSNRNVTADGPNSHLAVYSKGVSDSTGVLAGYSSNAFTRLFYLNGQLRGAAYSTSFATRTYYNTPTFVGVSRQGDVVTARTLGSYGTTTQSPIEPSPAGSHYIFAGNFGGASLSYTTAKLKFYSTGASLDLAKLESHVNAYVTAIGAAL